MVEREAFFMKPKRQWCLAQRVEQAFSPQTGKEKRLLGKSMSVLIDRWTLNFNNGGKGSFFSWNQSINIIYPNERNVFMVPNHEKNRGLLQESIFILIDKWNLILKNGGK